MSPHRRRRKSAHRLLVEEADAWVRAIVFLRQGPKCLRCSQVKPLHAAHILSKGAHPGIRFELDNVIGLCMKDHLFWAHREPIGFLQWIEELFPGRVERLSESARYRSRIDLKELICVLKSQYEAESRKVLGLQARAFRGTPRGTGTAHESRPDIPPGA